MDIIGLDLHQRESQLCLCDEDGTITECRIVTSRERFTAVLGSRPRAKILLEASTESEWVARHLRAPTAWPTGCPIRDATSARSLPCGTRSSARAPATCRWPRR